MKRKIAGFLLIAVTSVLLAGCSKSLYDSSVPKRPNNYQGGVTIHTGSAPSVPVQH